MVRGRGGWPGDRPRRGEDAAKTQLTPLLCVDAEAEQAAQRYTPVFPNSRKLDIAALEQAEAGAQTAGARPGPDPVTEARHPAYARVTGLWRLGRHAIPSLRSFPLRRRTIAITSATATKNSSGISWPTSTEA
jgi:hypothetical protein